MVEGDELGAAAADELAAADGDELALAEDDEAAPEGEGIAITWETMLIPPPLELAAATAVELAAADDAATELEPPYPPALGTTLPEPEPGLTPKFAF